MTLVFIVGKLVGPGSLTEFEAYRPVFTWVRFSESSVRFMNAIFYTRAFTIQRVIAAWMVLFYLAVRNRDRRLMLLWVWVIVTPLPVALLPDRGGGCLYIV